MKKIVIYYSYTGNTRTIAKKIAEKLKCDIVELEPVIPYSDNYDSVVAEYESNSTLKTCTEFKDLRVNLDEYDEIILGTPVWWYTIVPVVRAFLKFTDLTEKTIYPFATNAGWLGKTFDEIHSICRFSDVKEGMSIVFSGEKSRRELQTPMEEIDKWIETL